MLVLDALQASMLPLGAKAGQWSWVELGQAYSILKNRSWGSFGFHGHFEKENVGGGPAAEEKLQ